MRKLAIVAAIALVQVLLLAGCGSTLPKSTRGQQAMEEAVHIAVHHPDLSTDFLER